MSKGIPMIGCVLLPSVRQRSVWHENSYDVSASVFLEGAAVSVFGERLTYHDKG